MWRVNRRMQEEWMKHEDELRIVCQSSRKDIDELQTQMASILIGHAKQKDVLQDKNLTLQKTLEEMVNELRTSQERCAHTQDELDRCKQTLQEAEEESARCREQAVKLNAQSAEMEGLICERNKRENTLVEERDATSHRVLEKAKELIDAAVGVWEERASVKRQTYEGLDYMHIHKISINSEEFINTLSEVLQVNNVSDVCRELNSVLLSSEEQGMRQLSEVLRCTLVVFQSQSGRAEVYGEDSAIRVHAIFIRSGNYYMIVARHSDSDDSSYTFNLARLPEFRMLKCDRATEEEEKYLDNESISADKAVTETFEITLLQPEV
ncbi:hypothetical protein Q5P01_020005 [Channa striata]|uniref:Uncharacterized protein n=1 Tax=Channa striata TaxID=64152 RepID=A0AA88SAX8_CHASR|nr:hypothetical protein Q5P01_020005 [Channa striata]